MDWSGLEYEGVHCHFQGHQDAFLRLELGQTDLTFTPVEKYFLYNKNNSSSRNDKKNIVRMLLKAGKHNPRLQSICIDHKNKNANTVIIILTTISSLLYNFKSTA